MCYHVSTPTKKKLREKVNKKEVVIADFNPYYHVSGFKHPELPVMTSGDQSRIQAVTWGFIPKQMTEEKASAFFKGAYSLNAKAESIFTEPLYARAAHHNRCLIFVDGFFEWKHEGNAKIPHYIQMPDHEPFAFGGLWSDQDGELTANILTTSANELMATIHNTKKRMPFILPASHWDLWLDTKAPEAEVKKIIHKFPEGKLQAYEISTDITKKDYDSNVAKVQEEISRPKQQGLF